MKLLKPLAALLAAFAISFGSAGVATASAVLEDGEGGCDGQMTTFDEGEDEGARGFDDSGDEGGCDGSFLPNDHEGDEGEAARGWDDHEEGEDASLDDEGDDESRRFDEEEDDQE